MFSESNNKSPGIPIVLGGGGMRGISLLGFLDFIREQRTICSDYTGVSIGSVVAAFHTNGFSSAEITRIFAGELTPPSMIAVIRDLVPRLFNPFFYFEGGVVDLLPVMKELVAKYRLKPQPNLRIVAYDRNSLSPVVFEDEDYDLATALAASCAVPGMFRPVSCRIGGRRRLLVDGGVFHPQPGSLDKKPCIIGKLIDSLMLDLLYPDQGKDHVAVVGHPNCRFFGRLSLGQARWFRKYGYDQARAALLPAYQRGEIPVAA